MIADPRALSVGERSGRDADFTKGPRLCDENYRPGSGRSGRAVLNPQEAHKAWQYVLTWLALRGRPIGDLRATEPEHYLRRFSQIFQDGRLRGFKFKTLDEAVHFCNNRVRVEEVFEPGESEPSKERPGTTAKIELMRRRVELGQDLHHETDFQVR